MPEDISALNTNNLKKYLIEIQRYTLLTEEEEKELAKKVEKGDKEAFDRMVRSNLRLVVKIAKKYVTPEWQLADLIQEGNIGLIKTVSKFDYRRNVRFSTYASWWIKQSIVRSMSNKRRTIRLPHRKEEKLRRINKAIIELSQELERVPSLREVAERLGYTEQDISKLKNVSEKVLSIDSEIGDNGCYFLNMLNDSTYAPEAMYNKTALERETESILEKLQEHEKKIIKSRFAFERRNKQTLKEIAKELGISPETVRQIEIRVLKKIKKRYPYLKEYLRDYVNKV